MCYVKAVFSSWQYIAATSTLVAELSSHSIRDSELGLGRTLHFVKFIISTCPAAILDSSLGGGVVDNGEII